MGRRVSAFARLLWLGLQSSFTDYRRMFTWRSWTFGWLARLLAQVLFFALLGRLVGTPGAERFITLGNAIVLAPLTALGLVSSTTMERRLGTLQFLLLGRASPFTVLGSRGLYWLFDGVCTALLALLIAPRIVGIDVAVSRVLMAAPGIVLLGCSAYALALALSGLSIRWINSRAFVTGITTIALLTLTGVNVPAPETGVWALVAHGLPVTNGLPALREILDGGSLSAFPLLREAAVGLGWLALAYVGVVTSLRRAVRTGRLTATG